MKANPPDEYSGSDRTARKLGDFELIRLLGRGGMGEVWLARQISVGRQVALKLLPVELTQNARAVLRFRREAEAGGRLTHPNIATVYAAGLADGRLFIAQELVTGSRSLADWIQGTPRDHPLTPDYFDRVATVIALVARALEYGHAQGVIHRDVKPHNVLLTPEGVPKLVDFGLALMEDGFTVSQSGEVAGTYAYMSPEQARAHFAEVDHRTDIFSLGATLYELVTLRRPFVGDSVYEITDNILHRSPRIPSAVRSEIPSALDAACLRALEKRREDRFQSMGEFAFALDPAKVSASIEPQKPRVKHRIPLGQTRARVLFALLAATPLVAWLCWPQINKLTDEVKEAEQANPYRRLAFYPELEKFARQELLRTNAELSTPTPSDKLEAQLRSTLIPHVNIPANTPLSKCVSLVPELDGFSFAYQSVEAALTDRALDLAYPIAARDLLDLIVQCVPENIGWKCAGSEIKFAEKSVLSDPLVSSSYPIWDIMAVPPGFIGVKADAIHLLDLMQDDDGSPFSRIVQQAVTGVGTPSLVEIIRDNIEPGSWSDPNLANPSLTLLGDTIIVSNTPRVHRSVRAFLAGLRSCLLIGSLDDSLWDRILPENKRALDDEILRRRLESLQVSRPIDRSSFEKAISDLESVVHRDIVIPFGEYVGITDWLLGPVETIQGPSAPARILKDTIAPRWTVVGGVIHVGLSGYGAPLVIRPYPVWDLMRSHRPGQPKIPGDQLVETIRDNVGPDTWWDNPRTAIIYANGWIFINATLAVQDESARFMRNLHDSR